MKRYLLVCLLLGISSCGEKETPNTTAYFAGEIVNPTSDYVVLYKGDEVIDSARLDTSNRFAFSLQSIDEGLYHFDHYPEQQYVFLENGDSLLFRLNTIAFDESLVFMGSNEEVNNFLIEMFLNYEDEEKLVNSYYRLSPEEFSHKIDSLKNQKLDELNELTIGETLSEEGYAMAKAAIDYDSYLYMEKYPYYHKKRTGEDKFHELDKSFYTHHDQVDINNKELTYYKPYYDFVKHYIGNLSYLKCAKGCGDKKKDHLHLNYHKMQVIDSLVEETNLRDNLFRNVALDYLLKEHKTNEACDSFISKFGALSKNDSHKEEINHVYTGIKNLQPNHDLPHLELEDINGDKITIKELAKGKNTVFYFWTGVQKRHFRNNLKRIRKLQKLHPDHHFVGINVQTGKPQWVSILDEHKLDKQYQFRTEDFAELQNTLIVDGLNKCVVAKDTLIVNAFGNLYASSFEPTKKP